MFALDICRSAPFTSPLEKALLPLTMLAFLLAPLADRPLQAQGLQQEEAIDAIVGSDVKTEEAPIDEEVGRILAAIERTSENAERVRKAFNLESLEIVFVHDLEKPRSEIEKAVTEHQPEIETLRDSIEGSAMFYHAINSRRILVQDVVAVEFADEEAATVFVNGSAKDR